MLSLPAVSSGASAGPSPPASAQEQLRAHLREILGESPGDVDTVASQVFEVLGDQKECRRCASLSNEWKCYIVKQANKPDCSTLVVFQEDCTNQDIGATAFPRTYKIKVTNKGAVRSRKDWQLVEFSCNDSLREDLLVKLQNSRKIYEFCKSGSGIVCKPALIVSENPLQILKSANRFCFKEWLDLQIETNLEVKVKFHRLLTIFAKLADCLDFLHNKGVIHGKISHEAFFIRKEGDYENLCIRNLSNASQHHDQRTAEVQQGMRKDQSDLYRLFCDSVSPLYRIASNVERIIDLYLMVVALFQHSPTVEGRIENLGDKLREITNALTNFVENE